MVLFTSIYLPLILWYAYITISVLSFRTKQLHPRQHRLLLFSIDKTSSKADDDRRVVVIGKIIIDQYGDPATRSSNNFTKITVGGGGPQAAFGAAAALACRDHYFRGSSLSYDSLEFPPKQQVTFMGPIGLQNWNQQYTLALERILLPMLDTPPVLISSNDHITPTIDIWHDADEVQKWRPVHGSFDMIGADGLWRNRPSADDILTAIQNESADIVLHSIIESGNSPPGKGEDSLFLGDLQLMSKISTLGIEPVVFPDDCTLKVSDEDGESVSRLVAKANISLMKEDQTNNKLLVITPDKPCFDSAFATVDYDGIPSTEIIVRNGPSGSFHNQYEIPSATLKTSDNKPVNPTGAGNAYSAAYVACRGTGSSSEEAAVLATAVGAVVCEYEHLPEWSWSVLERIAEAAKEVESKLKVK